MARFEREVDPDGVLDPCERAKRAESARQAYYAKLAYQSARARRERAGTLIDSEKARASESRVGEESEP